MPYAEEYSNYYYLKEIVMVKSKRAFISVFDKAGIADFASELSQKHGFEIVSTGGTYKELSENKLPVTEISEITGFTRLLGGKVKSLHPFIHAAILAYRNNPDDMEELKNNDITPIDIVVCNLYPFEAAAKKSNAELAELIENIDIGGVTLLRSAAKNFASVAVVCAPEDYAAVLKDMDENNGQVSYNLRKKLMLKAFEYVTGYDALITKTLREKLGE
jgi:phosphoribosylaminoimidazolecarboxamide formyltransferase/IMP cyclohydrolase